MAKFVITEIIVICEELTSWLRLNEAELGNHAKPKGDVFVGSSIYQS